MNTTPLSPPAVKGAGRRELPAYLSNGVMGLRVRDNPLAAGMCLLNGYSGLHPTRKVEAAATAPYPVAGDIAVNGVWLSDVPHRVRLQDQAYDFSNGELTTRFSLPLDGADLRIEVVTFCCRHQPTLVVQQVSILANAACDLKIRSRVDTGQIHGRLKCRTQHAPGEEKDLFDGSLCWESEGAYASCGIAYVTTLSEEDAERKIPQGGDRSPLVTQYSLRARSGKSYRFQQIASLVPSVMHSQPDRHAERLAAMAAHYGFEKLRQANRAEWRELWKGRIILHGADRRWQQLADAAFFYVNASVHVSSSAATSMFGLATWHDYHYYYGHVMWDIESFAVPPLTLLQPDAAGALLDYRVRGMAAARSNAQSFGRNGLQFPWESAPSTSHEATPSPGKSCWHEDHISLDVALAFDQFCHVTGDGNFYADKAWPILSGVADWIVSRSHRTRRGYEIRRSMGIAERDIESDNEAFTMLSACATLGAALRCARALGRAPGAGWQDVAEHLVLPLRDGVLVSHDAFRANEEKAATPSPLMGVFPLWSDLSPSVKSATLDYFLPRARDYIGSPMLSAFYGVWAAHQGDRALAAKLLDEGYGQFVSGRFLQTLEYRPDRFPEQPQAGPFFANMGGFLMSLLLGFPALKPGPGDPGSWAQRDVVLPAGWREIEVGRVWIHGRPARLRARHGQRTTVTF